MSSFEDLGLPIEIVEALLVEGAEEPTRLQEDAIPLLMRGNGAVLGAGPGAGTLWAWSAPLLARALEDPTPGSILVLGRSAAHADALAEATGRLAAAAGLRVAGEDAAWVLPELAHVHVFSATTAAARLGESRLDLAPVRAIVVDVGTTEEALAPASRVFEALDGEVQRVVVALPLTDAVEEFTERHLRRAVHVPPRPADGAEAESVQRGSLDVVEIDEDRDEAAVREIARRLATTDHVAVYTRDEDAAADLADRLHVRGIASGRPGEPSVPVWLAIDPLDTRERLRESDAARIVVSHDVPADEDELDRRHSGTAGVVLALPRELPHLYAVAGRAGYTLSPAAPAPRPDAGISDTLGEIEAALEGEDVAAYLALLEPALQRHGAARVAAAAVALLRAKRPRVAPAATRAPAAGTPTAAPSPDEGGFTLLFVSLGSKDGMRVGDLVGAILGETGVPSDAIGKIDLRETFSRVEVAKRHVDTVVSKMNGTTIRGRSVRVDLDRSERGGGGGAPRGGRGPGGGRSGGESGRPRRRPRGGE